MIRRANEEIWIDIKGYEGHYQVSNMGRVKSLKSNKILAKKSVKGYNRIHLSKDGKRVDKYVHRLVMENFCPINDMNEMTVYHIYGDRSDDRLKNLMWEKKKNDKYIPIDPLSGEDNGNSKLSREDVNYIRNNFISGDPEFGRTGLAAKFKVSRQQIGNILNNMQWKES